MKSVLCLGEITWDRLWVVDDFPKAGFDSHILRESEGPGGSALNTAVALNSLQIPVLLAGNSLGNDERGFKIQSFLMENEIPNMVVQHHDIKTPFCQVFVKREGGDRSFAIDHEKINQFEQRALDKLISMTKNGKFSIAFVQAYLKEFSKAYLESVQDIVGLTLMTQDIDAESPLVELVDIVQISVADGTQLEPAKVTCLGETYMKGRCQKLIITAGEHGAATYDQTSGAIIYPASIADQICDTTGCGDAFRAGYLAELYKNSSDSDAIQQGLRLGKLKAQQYGSYLQ